MADSPLAHIKVQELLKEVRVDYSRTRVIDAAVAAVTETLLGLQDKEVVILHPGHACNPFVTFVGWCVVILIEVVFVVGSA